MLRMLEREQAKRGALPRKAPALRRAAKAFDSSDEVEISRIVL
jgi:hypothetical protein